MTEFVETTFNWFMGLGGQYGVNPIIFGSIYIGAIPFFTLSGGWLVRNYRAGKSVIVPALCTGFFFISSYLYLIIAGENVPWWVYLIIIMLVGGGGYSAISKIKTKANAK